MTVLRIYRGLPASGKTTHARAWVAEDRANRIRVNRDDLRRMIDDGSFVKGVTESRIIAVRDSGIRSALAAGFSVVCDDTNLDARTVRELINIAVRAGVKWEIIDLTDVSLKTCVERDLDREKPVGSKVIIDMYERFIAGKDHPLPVPEETVVAPVKGAPYVARPHTPHVVLVDLDGTVALANGRSPYDETRVIYDLPNQPVIDVVMSLVDAGHKIIFMSGRTEACREDTVQWIAENVCDTEDYHGLYMRPVGDSRKDSVVKLELFDRHVRERFNVIGVFDDRNQVVEMWRSIGLTVFQVAEGNF